MMNLPVEVMEIIVSKMTFQDVLTYPKVESIRQVIVLCPEKWHTRLFEYVKHVRDISNVKINTLQVDSYLTMEDTDVRKNASLTYDKNRTNLFSLQKICDGLLAKYETTYNWRVKQFHCLLNDDLNWNTDNIKTILHEVLLYYCNRLGFNKTVIIERINLLKPYIQELVCLTSRNDMQKTVFQFVINNLYDGNAQLMYIFITEGEQQVQVSIWSSYCAQLLYHVEEQQALKDRLINVGRSINWNINNIKSFVDICKSYNLMITLTCFNSIIDYIAGNISYEEIEEILLEDKQERYERLCTERLSSLGILSYYFEDLFSWECFDKFYETNDIDKFVDTVKDIYKIKNVLLNSGIEMVDGMLYKNDICIDDYVSFDVWEKCIEDCVSIHNGSNENMNSDKIIEFVMDLFDKLNDQ